MAAVAAAPGHTAAVAAGESTWPCPHVFLKEALRHTKTPETMRYAGVMEGICHWLVDESVFLLCCTCLGS